ncbi:MAG: tryptophan 2,3-dioxygenase family protein [Gemmatimonadota bacterium]
MALQKPESDEHDEVLFIIIHQVYELWFKQLLYELDHLCRLLRKGEAAPALHTLKRILTILKLAVAQTDILETMTPLEFVAFRDRLETASGSQSFQFRELEFLLGMKRPNMLGDFDPDSEGQNRLKQRLIEPTVWDALVSYLLRRGYAVPTDLLQRDVTQPVEPSPGMQAVLLRIYREDPEAMELCERLVDLDEGVQEWRYRHVKMVERTIGEKQGTGGSSGVRFLKKTLFHPAFPDLWAIRSEL